MNRTQNLQQLRRHQFDVCIIGAGASGAGAALDAALRGYRVALIERNDFASETSSKATKLVHGGVRYLEQAIKKLDLAQLRQVRHGLVERHTVLRNAPHLAHPLAILTPVFSAFEGFYISLGLWLYDVFARDKHFPKSRWLTRIEALKRMPALNPNLHSAVCYYDGQLNDARYALALAHTADEAGAVVANYVTLTGFERNANGHLTAAHVQDSLTGETFTIQARLFLNCTGPFADSVRLMANPNAESRIRPSKGVHMVLPRDFLAGNDALLIPKTSDGRVVFAIPFLHSVLVGTTDNDYQNLHQEPELEPAEIDYLLETLRPYVAQLPGRPDVKAGFGGIRPLITSQRAKTKSLLRDHEVEVDEVSGLLSLLGGKWTTYRLMAQDAIDRVGEKLGHNRPGQTLNHYLVGGEAYRFEEWRKLAGTYSLPDDVAQHLMQTYGSRAERVAIISQEKPDFQKRILPETPFMAAEVIYQIRDEMAVTVRDVLARRWRLELENWQLTEKAIDPVAELMAAELRWPDTYRQQQTQTYRALLAQFSQQAGLP